jgi:hypothetical protein
MASSERDRKILCLVAAPAQRIAVDQDCGWITGRLIGAIGLLQVRCQD